MASFCLLLIVKGAIMFRLSCVVTSLVVAFWTTSTFGNLLTNGDFEQGNVGFQTSLTYTDQIVPGGDGHYTITTNPSLQLPGWVNTGDSSFTGAPLSV